MTENKATDIETGISIRFVREFTIEPDMAVARLCSEHGIIQSSPCQRCADVEEGRCEILREIAAMDPQFFDNSNDPICAFCREPTIGSLKHTPDCLWLRAYQVPK